VEPGSPAAATGITPGDVVFAVNGHRLRDVIDYQFHASDAVVTLEMARHSSQSAVEEIHIVKDEGESLGITFTQPTFAPIRECNNHCPFCFIDQLPHEMRSSLYIRDDDYRYSFLFGNFVTLTNLNEKDWRRLEEQKLSPLYVSVHATEPKLRRLLLGNDRIPDIRRQLDRLFDIGIKVHTQVVVCPGINDGVALDDTVRELNGRYPDVLSVGVVPVGLTRTPEEILADPDPSCSRILPSAANLGLRQFEPAEALAVVEQLKSVQQANRRAYGKTIVYASDELYLLAGNTVPSAQSYDGYPQYENGIGMVRDLLDDWARTRRRLGRSSVRIAFDSVSLVCGEMAAPILEPIVAEWAGLVGIDAEVVPIRNSFFGPRVKVSGLLTGRDIIANKNRLRGSSVLLPEVMLDKTGSRLLDNMKPEEVELALGRPVGFAGAMSKAHNLLSCRKAA
jgi:putative radical SAM enzyme (TIGR03279 family)